MRERAKLAGRSLEFKSEREKGGAVTDAGRLDAPCSSRVIASGKAGLFIRSLVAGRSPNRLFLIAHDSRAARMGTDRYIFILANASSRLAASGEPSSLARVYHLRANDASGERPCTPNC